MARWLLFTVAVLVNVAAVLVALSPSVVTYADVQPAGVTCTTCTAEAQAAVIRAAAIGRAQIQSLVGSNEWLLIAIALANVAVVGALVWMLRSNRTIERDARKSGARPPL